MNSDELVAWAHQVMEDSDAWLNKWATEENEHPFREYGDDWIDWNEILGEK